MSCAVTWRRRRARGMAHVFFGAVPGCYSGEHPEGRQAGTVGTVRPWLPGAVEVNAGGLPYGKVCSMCLVRFKAGSP